MQSGRPKKRADGKSLAGCEPRVACYRLFTGYKLNDKGEGVLTSGDLEWTEHSILNCVQGWKLEERNSRKLWFVAPQMGDRLIMIKTEALQLMGGQTGEKAVKIAECLVCDNVMAYMQSAVIGTLCNMLPCDANSEFDKPVMTAIDLLTKTTAVHRIRLRRSSGLRDNSPYATGWSESSVSITSFTVSEESSFHPDKLSVNTKPDVFKSVTNIEWKV
ncbi:protein phosphatase 1 regulatory subunit 3A/B/C/D/E [Sarotherodon galilaeus]